MSSSFVCGWECGRSNAPAPATWEGAGVRCSRSSALCTPDASRRGIPHVVGKGSGFPAKRALNAVGQESVAAVQNGCEEIHHERHEVGRPSPKQRYNYHMITVCFPPLQTSRKDGLAARRSATRARWGDGRGWSGVGDDGTRRPAAVPGRSRHGRSRTPQTDRRRPSDPLGTGLAHGFVLACWLRKATSPASDTSTHCLSGAAPST